MGKEVEQGQLWENWKQEVKSMIKIYCEVFKELIKINSLIYFKCVYFINIFSYFFVGVLILEFFKE